MPKRRSRENKSLNGNSKDMPPRKRQRIANNITSDQIDSLPQLRNPKFFKQVYQYWQTYVSKLKDGSHKKITSPKIEHSTLTDGPPDKRAQCTMTVSKCNLDGDPITIRERGPSKAKSLIMAWRSLVLKSIPFEILKDLMAPYSVKSKHEMNCVSLSNTSRPLVTVELFPIPLSFTEANCFDLCQQLEVEFAPNRIEFSRHNNTALCQKLHLQFDDAEMANTIIARFGEKFGEFIDIGGFEARIDLSTKSFPAWESLAGKTLFLVISGFAVNLEHDAEDSTDSDAIEKKILRYLEANGIDLKDVVKHTLVFRYSMMGMIFLQFRSHQSATRYLKVFLRESRGNPWSHNGVTSELHARYATKNEVDNRPDLLQTLNEVPRPTDSVDVSNVAWDVTKTEIQDLFGSVGTVISCHVFPRKDMLPGRAFVRFDDEDAAMRSIQKLNGKKCRGLRLNILSHFRSNHADRKLYKALRVVREEEAAEERRKLKVERRQKQKLKNRKRKLRRRLAGKRQVQAIE